MLVPRNPYNAARLPQQVQLMETRTQAVQDLLGGWDSTTGLGKALLDQVYKDYNVFLASLSLLIETEEICRSHYREQLRRPDPPPLVDARVRGVKFIST